MLQLFLSIAVRIDRNYESSVSVEFGGARGALVLKLFAVPLDCGVKVPKRKLVLVLLEERFRFRLLFDEQE